MFVAYICSFKRCENYNKYNRKYIMNYAVKLYNKIELTTQDYDMKFD